MAVDRGELRYKIAVDDAFSKPIGKFREELLKAKNTLDFVRESTAGFRNLQRDIAGSTSAMRSFRTTSAQASNEEKQANREAQQRLREIAAEQKKRNANEKLRADILKAQRADAEKTAAAERRAAAEAEKAQRKAAAATRQHAAAARDLNKSILDTDTGVNRVAFTFRRLFGILAAFTLARQVVSSFTSLVGSSIQFNRTVEDSAVGLASLFVASGEVRNNYGQLVEGAEAFKIAQQEAVIQGNKLRQDALLTTATYEELLVAFQAAVGPGLAAGLNLDQVRQVAVNISQAAAAFGLEQNQLAEEVRSLITGTGQLRTTRLAQVISNEDIRNAREAGKLFDLLTSRLKPFALAAEVTQKNFSGLVARLQDAVGLASGGAGLAFFTELKLLLGDLGDLFIEVKKDANGVIQSVSPDPRAVQSLAIVFNGLKDAVGTIRAGIQTLDLTQTQNALSLIADTFRGVATIVVGLVRGLIGGFSDVAVIAQSIFAGFDTKLLSEAAALVGRIGTLLVVGSLATSALVGGIKLLLAPLGLAVSLVTGLGSGLVAAGRAVALIPGPVRITLAALIGLAFILRRVLSSILDIELGFSDLPEVIGAVVEQVSTKFFGFVDGIGALVSVRVRQALVSFVSEASIAFTKVKALILDAFAAVGNSDAAVAAAEAEQAAVNKRLAAAKELKALELELTEATKVQAQVTEDANKRAGDRIQALRNAIEKAKGDDNGIPVQLDTTSISSQLSGLLADVNSTLTGLIGGDVVDEQGIADKLAEVGKKIQEQLGKITGRSQDDVTKQSLNSFGQLIRNAQQYINLLTNAVQSFASFASDAIVDAFDPNQDVDLKERFAQFLQGLAKQILQTIFTLLVATAVAKAFGVPLASNPESIPSLPSFAEGGTVPDAGSPIPRPASVPKSDTTLAWLTPGEVVQSLAAVRNYGADVLLALNDGLIDPLALRALAGLGGQRSVRRSVAASGALSFANGGLVPSQGVSAAKDASERIGKSEPAQPAIAVVVGNEQSLDRMLRGGRRAMLDFLSENKAEVGSILQSVSK